MIMPKMYDETIRIREWGPPLFIPTDDHTAYFKYTYSNNNFSVGLPHYLS